MCCPLVGSPYFFFLSKLSLILPVTAFHKRRTTTVIFIKASIATFAILRFLFHLDLNSIALKTCMAKDSRWVVTASLKII